MDQELGKGNGAGLMGLGRRIDHCSVDCGHTAVHAHPTMHQVDVPDGQRGCLTEPQAGESEEQYKRAVFPRSVCDSLDLSRGQIPLFGLVDGG